MGYFIWKVFSLPCHILMHDRALRGAIYALTGRLFGSGGLQNMAISGTKFGYYGGLTGTRPENLFWSHTTFHNQTRIRDIFDFSRPAVTAHRNAKSVKSPSLRTDTVGSSLLLEKAEIALFCTLDCRTVSPLLQTAEGLVSGIFEFTTSNLGGEGGHISRLGPTLPQSSFCHLSPGCFSDLTRIPV